MSGGLVNSFDAPSPIVVGGRYRLVTELGRGGMGVVHRARDERTGREVALKLVPKASAVEWQRLVREGRALAALEHPNIVAVLDAGEAGHEAFLVMALVNGRSLADRLRVGPLPIAEACAVAEGVARALAHAHAHGVLHRDVKPANVLLEQDGTPRLCDFGLARQAGDGRMTTTGELVGTPSFMAPEQAQGASAATGPWTDSWGLGALLYALLTGRPPFEASSVMGTILQVLEAAPAAPASLRPEVPAALEALCLRCLEKEPARRPTAQQVADALAGLRVAEGRARRRVTRVAPRPSRWPLALAGAALVAALAAGAYALIRRAPTAPPRGSGASAGAVSTRVVVAPPEPVVAAPPPPATDPAALARAQARLAAHDLPGAATALRAAAAHDPRAAALQRAIARFAADLVDRADDEEAQRLVREALGDTPLAGDAWIDCAERHVTVGQYAAARRASERALALGPAPALRAWALSLGSMWSARPAEEAAEAMAAAEAAVRAAPDSLPARLVLGRMRLAIQREREDLDAVARGGDAWLAARALASIAAVKLDLDAAARACELDPQSATAWAHQGYVLSAKGRHPEALVALDRALALDPRDVGGLKHRGIARLQLDDARGAREDLDGLLRLWPDSRDGYFWRARAAVNVRLSRRDAAIADLERAVMDRSQRAQARAELATLRGPAPVLAALPAAATSEERLARVDLLRERGDLEAALRELDALTAAQPSLAEAWGGLALVRALDGDDAGARAALERCAARGGGAQAVALALLRDPAAVAAADDAVEARRHDPLARLARALVRRSLGDRRGAQADIRAGLAVASARGSGWTLRQLEALERWASSGTGD